MERLPDGTVNITWEFLIHQQNNVSLKKRYICVIEDVKLDFAKQWQSKSPELTWRVIGQMDSDEQGQLERTFLLYKVNRDILKRFIEVLELYSLHYIKHSLRILLSTR